MHPFTFYLQMGFDHISDLAGFDHILFLVALCAVYRIEQWRNLLILVTAFTLGHSITLALASLGILTISSELIEFLIPTTILFTALHNVFGHRMPPGTRRMGWNYAMALFFGLIHGMGFSNYFRALLMDDSSIFIPLLGFNLGIELGQLLIVAVIVGVAFACLRLAGFQHREWNLFISGGAAGMALMLMAETRFW
ncbi:MAG: HupE/UreJ family protein [Pseudomonadota bacterium]